MSWSVSYPSRDAFLENAPTSVNCIDDAEDIIETAREAAKLLINSGALGDLSKDFTVYLGGHANPKHEPRVHYSNDCVTITISQK